MLKPADAQCVERQARIARITAPLRSRYGALAAHIGRSKIALHSTRILARSTGGLSVTAAVNGAAGRPTTGEDWLMTFALAGAGHGAGELGGHYLEKLQKKHNVTFALPLLGAAKGGADGMGQAPIKIATHQALEAPFALGVGVGSEAIKEGVVKRSKDAVREVVRNEPVIVERAWARYERGYKGGGRARAHSPAERAELQRITNEEVEAVVNGKVDPAFDFVFGAGGQAAEKVHETATKPPPRPPPPVDLPGTPTGTVAQRVRSHR